MAAIRYIVDDVERAIAFYRDLLGFELENQPARGFAALSRGDLMLYLNAPAAGGAGRAGGVPEPGGWNRFQLEVEDLDAMVKRLTGEGATFRNGVVAGKGGQQILLEDPSGNPIELFQRAGRRALELTTGSAPKLRTKILLHGEQTGGHVSVTEIVVPPHCAGPPLHTHDFDEAFYMLEGELIFQLEDVLVTKDAGEAFFAPRNVAHTLANHTDAPGRYVLVCTPAGFERHWARIAAETDGLEPPQWALQPIPEITVVGPQIVAPA